MRRVECRIFSMEPSIGRSVIALRLSGALASLGLACGLMLAPAIAIAHGPTIEISHEAMKPTLLNLFVGTTVHFSNTVEMPGGHVVVEKEGRLESPPLEHPGDGWHYTFEAEGVYEVFVRQHPEARARIVVVPKRATPGR